MEEFTTAKNITELETSEEKELRKADKKRKQQEGEELLQGLKNNRSTEKGLRRAEKKRQKQDGQAFIETLRNERTQKKAERTAEQEANKKKGEEILKYLRKIQDNKNEKETILIIDEQGASQPVDRVLTEDGDIYKFDNSNSENNCWLNSVLQVLIHLVKSVQNEDYQYRDVQIQAFMNYLKDPRMKMNSGKLCVTDENIHIPGELQTVSMKNLFTTLIEKKEWNSDEQQDSSEVLLFMLNCLMERGMDGPSNFCQYRTNVMLTCSRCHVSSISGGTIENVLLVTLTQDGIDSMRQALQDTLKRTFNEHRHCENCNETGIYEDLQILETNQFFHILIISPSGRCVPLQDFKLRLTSGIVKKYELQCIIQRYGIDANNGHFWLNLENV